MKSKAKLFIHCDLIISYKIYKLFINSIYLLNKYESKKLKKKKKGKKPVSPPSNLERVLLRKIPKC